MNDELLELRVIDETIGLASAPTLHWLRDDIRVPDRAIEQAARERQAQLTKPPGALGALEALAIRLAGLQRRERPRLDRVRICVFAADHGVAAEGVSAFPQAVTAQMIANIAGSVAGAASDAGADSAAASAAGSAGHATRGGAAISVLARELGAALEVVDLGTVAAVPTLPTVRRERIAAQTANLARTAAMTPLQLAQALASGRAAAQRAQQMATELFIGGEMGIANTTSATALACALLGLAPHALTGPGTGLDAAGVARKAALIERALALHAAALDDPREVLRRLGGFEIAALVGSYIACAQLGIAVLVDGFIASAAALVATRLAPACAPWLLYAHRSAEPGHVRVLDALGAAPLLDLGLRLGEGSGAAVAVPLLRAACALHTQMATFADAGVAGRC